MKIKNTKMNRNQAITEKRHKHLSTENFKISSSHKTQLLKIFSVFILQLQ